MLNVERFRGCVARGEHRARMRHMMADSWWWADWENETVSPVCVRAPSPCILWQYFKRATFILNRWTLLAAHLATPTVFATRSGMLKIFNFMFSIRFRLSLWMRQARLVSWHIFFIFYFIFIRIIIMPNSYSVSGPLVYIIIIKSECQGKWAPARTNACEPMRASERCREKWI